MLLYELQWYVIVGKVKDLYISFKMVILHCFQLHDVSFKMSLPLHFLLNRDDCIFEREQILM